MIAAALIPAGRRGGSGSSRMTRLIGHVDSRRIGTSLMRVFRLCVFVRGNRFRVCDARETRSYAMLSMGRSLRFQLSDWQRPDPAIEINQDLVSVYALHGAGTAGIVHS
jgi:hypothetical protein